MSHDTPVGEGLKQYMTEHWAPLSAADVAVEPVAAYAAKRRDALSARFPGQTLVVPTGTPPVRANDTDYRFRPGSDYYWLTGDQAPDGVLLFTPDGPGHRVELFLPPRADRSTTAFYTDRRYGELWVGARRGVAETAQALDLACRSREELPDVLSALPADTRVLRGFDAEVDAAVEPEDLPEEEPEEEPEATTPDGTPQERYVGRDAELAQALSELRLVKDELEVAALEEAVAATVRGFEDVVRELPQAIATSERWIEGTFDRRARVEGNDVGYGSIAACGHHATTLHWVDNHGPVHPGDLALLDMGVESRSLYTADVTRTLPINGRYSAVQRRVYSAVLAAQRAALAEVRPGNEFLAPHRAAMRVLAGVLAEWGLLPVPVEQALEETSQVYRRYTLHGTSHMLGIDVHDCASAREQTYRKGELVAGMVITVEPGLYFQRDDLTVPEELRGIGVRIEDDVLVTADGYRNLSVALPTDPDEVEAWMAGLLPGA